MGKYLDNTGLQVLWNKIKSVFLPKSGGTITGNLKVTDGLSVDGQSLYVSESIICDSDIYTGAGVNLSTSGKCQIDIGGCILAADTGPSDLSIYADTVTADGAMTCDSLTSSTFVTAGAMDANTITVNNLYIGLDYDCNFESVNANLVRLNKANLIIGTTSDSRNLSVCGDSIVQGTLYVDNIKGNSENSTNLTLGTGSNDGYVHITDDMFGKNTDGGESWSIMVNSGAASFSSVSQTSDQRLKENIQDVSTEFEEKYWDTENGLIHEYDWIKSKKHANGMIAQELLNYIPEAVNYNVEADSYSVDYTSATCKIMGAMFKKIKSLENEIITMKQEIEKLKNKQL